ncbi:hypothetical protein K461DRAFT_280459 [Myriangium duriaei CBS 260.36]|uniref:SWI-SNF chromatin-remodeling complex protein n=1 Tax=Myriangium duriaei CBS 260.36 TaxID=1168546 RepID=A0A9P4IXN3_9PEZI|nr:hypothetical protein K461DRAFT_280459 [Myriangium duriaei CBS 260.36]
MSRPPFHPGEDRPQSPFDRPSPSGSGPAPSFKTNVNRNKTRKWVEARHNNYDGDDWDGFDPYDEYGSYDEPAGQQPPPLNTRKHSFDRGEERRAFSAGVAPPQGHGQFPPNYPNPQQPYADRPRTGSQGSRDAPGFRREFSQPAQVPQPLHMRPTPPSGQMGPRGPQTQSASGPSEQLPLRDANAIDDGKPAAAIPFIRPSDIYKRMEQEKERQRQSQDSSRPSIDSSSSNRPVAETEGQRAQELQHDAAPSASVDPAPSSNIPATLGLNQQPLDEQGSGGFQTIVDKAFNRPDENSVPATPASTAYSQLANQDLSRSNTDSTSGISPIMSRVPSSGNPDSRNRVAAAATAAAVANSRVSTISEEVPTDSQAGTTSHRPTSGASFGSVARKEVGSPSPHASPARTPLVETDNRRLSQAMAAEMSQEPPKEIPLSTINTRTVEPAAASGLETNATPSTAGERTIRNLPSFEALRQSSRLSSPLASPVVASPVNGRTSPFPGRVRDLAGKYNEIHDQSRRNSQMSLESKRSFGSLSRNGGSLRIKRTGTTESLGQGPITDEPTTDSPIESSDSQFQQDRPPIHPQPSFRPSLPGEWISTTDVRQESSAPAAQDKPHLPLPAEKALPKTPTPESRPSDVDLTPVADKGVERQASMKSSENSPIDALKAAGAALGESLRLSVGSAHQSKDFASREEPPVEETQATASEEQRPAVGDVYLRPLHFDRAASSVASSIAPTPPAKDTPKVALHDTEKEYFDRSNTHEDARGQSFTDSSVDEDDFTESDRLHEDIVRSLSPNPVTQVEHQSHANIVDMPHDSRQAEHAREVESTAPAPLMPLDSTTSQPENVDTHNKDARPDLLSQRFSWENRTSGFFNPSGLGAEVDLPQSDLRVINPEPEVQAPERDISMDKTLDAPQSSTAIHAPEAPEEHQPNAVSSIVGSDNRLSTSSTSVALPENDNKPEARDRSSNEFNAAGSSVPETPVAEPSSSSAKGPSRIPPFREILAIKSPNDRIATYESTRKQFAEMNTGLRDWLVTTMAARPEHSHLNTAGPSLIPGGPVPESIRHRPTPSIVKYAKGLGSSSRGDTPSSPSTDNPNGPTRRVSNNYAGHSPQASVNVEKMQAMGKDFLSSAGKLGGKGVVGAKGWLAKGRQKLRESSGTGGDKAFVHEPLSSASVSATRATAVEESKEVETSRPSSPVLLTEELQVPKGPHPKLHIRSSSTRSIQRMVSESRRSSPLATPTLEQTSDANPGFPDGQMLSLGPGRPRLHQRSSSSWSSHRLSATIERIRGNVSERSRSRSRPQSLILPSRTPPPALQIGTTELRLDDLEERSPVKLPEGSATSTTSNWASVWETGVPNTPATAFLNGGNYRLGVLPSPGVESFLETQSIGLRTPVAGSPLRMGSLALDPRRPGEQERPHTSPLSPSKPIGEVPVDDRSKSLADTRDRDQRPSSDQQEQPNTAGGHPEVSSSNKVEDTSSVVQQIVAVHDQDGTDPQSHAERTPTLHDQGARLFASDDSQSGHQDNVQVSQQRTPTISSIDERPVPQNSVMDDVNHDNTAPGSEPRDEVRGSQRQQPSVVNTVHVSPPDMSGNTSTSQQVTPRREIESLEFNRRNMESPTVPAHLTPHSPRLPQHMFDGDHSTVTTPGNERQMNEAMFVEELNQSPTAPTLREAVQQWPAPDSPPFTPRASSHMRGDDENNNALVRQEPVASQQSTYPDSEQPHAGWPSPPQQLPNQRPRFSYRAALEQVPDNNMQAWQQDQLEPATAPYMGTQDSSQGNGHYVGHSAQPFGADSSHDNWADMSPQEAALADREDLFAQATANQYRARNARPTQSRSSSMGADATLGQVPGRSLEASVTEYNAQRPASRILGRPPNVTTSTSTIVPSNNQAVNLSVAKGPSDTNDSAKGKLVKKERRFSLHRSTSGVVSEDRPDAEKKKKRFSGLGSLFGRSKSSAGKVPSKDLDAPKRNRLSKQGPMIVSAPRQASPEKVPPPPGYEQHVPPSDQATLVHDDMHPRSHTPVSRTSSTHMSPMLGGVPPPHAGWSNPSGQPGYVERPEPTIPNIEPSRRLHSSRPVANKRFSFADVAEEFQPVAASYRSGASPRDQTRLGQAFGEIPPIGSPPIGRSHPGASPSQHSMNQAWSPVQPNARHSSGMSATSGATPEFSRRASSGVSQNSGSTPQRQSYYNDQRSGSIGQVSANQPPPGWADYGGYYIPQQRTASPHAAYRQSSSEIRPGQQSRRSSQDPYQSNSAQHSRQGSLYMPADNGNTTASQYPSTDQAYGYSPSKRGHSEVHSPMMAGTDLQAPRSPTQQQTTDHNEWVRREYEKKQREIVAQQNQSQGPSRSHNEVGGGYDTELYESTYRQPRRSLERPKVNTEQRAQSSNQQSQMRSTSYPGQEWTPPGIEQGNYEWE